MIDALHFLRPLWLLAIPASALAWWMVRRRQARNMQLGDFVAPHLKNALTMNRDGAAGIKPVDGVASAMLLLAIAAAGPAWDKQASPWFEETAPLVVAMEITDSMRANDLEPTRLDRARFKVLDLVGARTGSRTALIAYAGTAHIVMPPSTDIEVLKPFIESLDPAVMPQPGTNAAAVLPLAREMLGEDATVGTLLFVNDGFDAADLDAFTAFAGDASAPPMAALVVGTDEGGVALLPDGAPVTGPTGAPLDTRIDEGVLREFERGADVAVVRAATGDADIRALLRTIDSNLRQADDPDAAWRDQGWWFLLPALILGAAWFRRGWTMRW